MSNGKTRSRRGAPRTHERRLAAEGYQFIAGVDEVGRGPIAGPVVAAAVIMPETPKIVGVTDSKKLTASRRDELEIMIREMAVAWGIGWSSANAIDATDILRATHVAMRMALSELDLPPDFILVDGRPVPDLCAPSEAIVGGDSASYSIAAASILAKVYRDRVMGRLDQLYPGYGFAQSKGYASAGHREALAKLGPSPVHRMSFEPLRSMGQASFDF